MPVKMLWLANYGGPYRGSWVPLLLATLNRASERGWEVEAVFGPAARERPWLEGLNAARIPVRFAPLGLAPATRWVMELIAEGPPGVVLHTHFTSFDAPSAIASLRSRRPRPAIFWHIHTALRSSARARARNMARFALLGRTIDGIFTPSVDLREQVIPGGAPTRKVHTIPNGLDIERFSLLSADERAAAREALDMPQDATVLLHFGWDWHRKGGDLFLDTVRRLLDDARWRHRTLLAVTSQGGEPARRLAAQLGLSDHVRTVGRIDDIETLHATADILLATSRARAACRRSRSPRRSAGEPRWSPPRSPTTFTPPRRRRRAASSPMILPRSRRPWSKCLGSSALSARADAERGHDWIRQERSMSEWVGGCSASTRERLSAGATQAMRRAHGSPRRRASSPGRRRLGHLDGH